MSKLDTSAPIEGPFPFEPFPKIARLRRDCGITEKIDGTNASVTIVEDDGGPGILTMSGTRIYPASRNRWIDLEHDNAGFASWVLEHANELAELGVGTHYGEWWGAGIQRRYGQERKRFSLFNTARWADPADRPECVGVVPVLYQGPFNDEVVEDSLDYLRLNGSLEAPGFMDPEGVVVFLAASRTLYKVTLVNDEKPKGSTE